MKYTLKKPFEITSRLLPGITVCGATISVDPTHRGNHGRVYYRYFIDISAATHPLGKAVEHEDKHLSTCGLDIEEAMVSLLGFLGAAAESRQFRERRYGGIESEVDPDSNESLFPREVVDWAAHNSDEISMLQSEIEEADVLVEVEKT